MSGENNSSGGYDSVAEDVYNRASGSAGGGLNQEVKRGAPVVGFVKPLADPRLVRFDRTTARQRAPVSWEATKDDRMSAKEAGDKMQDIYTLYGFKGALPDMLEAFHAALYFMHTLNSSSVLQPGRAKLVVAGHEMSTHYLANYLGNDSRRFWRAYADEVRANNIRVLQSANDPSDFVAWEKAQLLKEVADSRGLSRYPDLAHDTSDACQGLTDGERTALQASKSLIFSTGVNMADRNRFRPGQSDSSAVGSMNVMPTAQAQALADA